MFSSWRTFSALWLFFAFYLYFWDYYIWAYFSISFFANLPLVIESCWFCVLIFIKHPILIFALGTKRRILWKLQNWLNAGWNLVILPKLEYTIYSFQLRKCNTHSQSNQLCNCIPEAVAKYGLLKTGVLWLVKKLWLCFWTTQWLISWHNSK